MTFTFTTEEIKTRRHRTEHIRLKVKMKIAEALLHERVSRKLGLDEVSAATKILPQNIENLELCKGTISWQFIGVLLKYYGKSFQIHLTDIPDDSKD